MKKIMLIAVVALCAMSCGNKANKCAEQEGCAQECCQQAVVEEAVVADSAAVEVVEPVVEASVAE